MGNSFLVPSERKRKVKKVLIKKTEFKPKTEFNFIEVKYETFKKQKN